MFSKSPQVSSININGTVLSNSHWPQWHTKSSQGSFLMTDWWQNKDHCHSNWSLIKYLVIDQVPLLHLQPSSTSFPPMQWWWYDLSSASILPSPHCQKPCLWGFHSLCNRQASSCRPSSSNNNDDIRAYGLWNCWGDHRSHWPQQMFSFWVWLWPIWSLLMLRVQPGLWPALLHQVTLKIPFYWLSLWSLASLTPAIIVDPGIIVAPDDGTERSTIFCYCVRTVAKGAFWAPGFPGFPGI